MAKGVKKKKKARTRPGTMLLQDEGDFVNAKIGLPEQNRRNQMTMFQHAF